MKNLFTALCFAMLFSAGIVHSQEMTIETYNTQEPPQGEYDGRQPAKTFEVKNGVDPVIYFKYEIGGNGAWDSHPLAIMVVKEDGTVAYNYPFDPGGASGIYYTNSPVPEGKYMVKIVEANDESYIWASKEFTVAPAMAKVKGSDKVIFCDYVDDSWNPIGATTKIKAGQCVNLMVELPKAEEGVISVGWMIFRVKGGKEEFISELMMTMPTLENIKHFATTEQICKFDKPGKYRVYAINWYDRNINSTEGNYKKYYAKGDLTVE